jgi:hypothetical protein
MTKLSVSVSLITDDTMTTEGTNGLKDETLYSDTTCTNQFSHG